MNKTANDIRTYVKESRLSRYVLPGAMLATLGAGAYALAPRSSDGPPTLLDAASIVGHRMKDTAGIFGSNIKTQLSNLWRGQAPLSATDQLKLQLQMYGMVAKDLGRQGSLHLKNLRGVFKELGVPTYPGDKMDEIASIFSAPFK